MFRFASFYASNLGEQLFRFKSSAPRKLKASAAAAVVSAVEKKIPVAAEVSPAKRPPSAYNLFVKALMPEVKDKVPHKERFSHINAAWSSLSPDKKKPYEAEAQAYRAENQTLKPIKKPPHAYGLYVQQQFAAVASKNPTLKAPEILRFVAGLWKAMPEKEKKERQAASAALRAAFSAR